MPMRLDQIEKFEKLNDLPINVYMTDTNGKNIWPVYISKRRQTDSINMQLLTDGEKSHYTLIKDFNALLSYDKMQNCSAHIVYMDMIKDIQIMKR